MRCLFYLVLLLPIFLLILFSGAIVNLFRILFGSRSKSHDSTSDNPYRNRRSTPTSESGQIDKPIDQSTVEYIDFEEIDEEENNKKQN